MSFFDAQQKVVEIDADNQVTVRKLTYGESKGILSRAMKTNPRTGDMEMDIGIFQLERMKCAVVSWEGPDFAGHNVNKANIEKLPTWVGAKLDEALDELNSEPDADEGNA